MGGTKGEIDQYANLTIQEALQQLTAVLPPPAPPIDPATGSTWINSKTTDANSEGGDLMGYFLSWWMDQMVGKPANLTEKVTYFYHTHFTTRREVVDDSVALYHQNALYLHKMGL